MILKVDEGYMFRVKRGIIMIHKNMNKKVIGVVLSALSLGLLTGCGAKAAGTVGYFDASSAIYTALSSAESDITEAEKAAEEAKKKAEEEATTEAEVEVEEDVEEVVEDTTEEDDGSQTLDTGVNITNLEVDDSKLESDNEKVGVYLLTGMDGSEVSEADLALMNGFGVSTYLVLYNDGTGFLNLYGEVENLTWDESTMTAQGDTTTYTYETNKITLSAGEASMIFTRTESY